VLPPLEELTARRRLASKFQKFKNFYTKYRNLHDSLAALPNPPQVDLDKLQKLCSLSRSTWGGLGSAARESCKLRYLV
jgi:hypothetical protein